MIYYIISFNNMKYYFNHLVPVTMWCNGLVHHPAHDQDGAQVVRDRSDPVARSGIRETTWRMPGISYESWRIPAIGAVDNPVVRRV